MKNIFAAAFVTFFTAVSYGYQDGTYRCKSSDISDPNLANDKFKIQTITLPGSTVSVPYVEATLRYHSVPTDPKSDILETQLSGVAVVSKNIDSERLILAGLRLLFVNGKMKNCTLL
jgi:hypothetical protein